MSTSNFRHNFAEITGTPPGEYLVHLRLRKAMVLLKFPYAIAEIAALCGFSDSNYFSRIVRKRTGYSPREIQNMYFSGEITESILLEKISGKQD